MGERLWTGWIIGARLLYIGATTLRRRKPDAIFLSEFLIQPLSFDTSGDSQDLDLYIMDVWETLHIKLNGINNTSVARGSTKDVQSIIAAHIFHLNYS